MKLTRVSDLITKSDGVLDRLDPALRKAALHKEFSSAWQTKKSKAEFIL